MAGSIGHCVDITPGGQWTYRGTHLLENMGDMTEATEEMMFVILSMCNRWGGVSIVEAELAKYGRCLRGEEPWPPFFNAPKAREE